MPLFIDAIGCIKSGRACARKKDLKKVPKSYMEGFFYEAVEIMSRKQYGFKVRAALPCERQKFDKDMEAIIEAMRIAQEDGRRHIFMQYG